MEKRQGEGEKNKRKMDPFWDFVEKQIDGSRKCRYCGHIFAPATSITRIKTHLSRAEEQQNVKICAKVPPCVQQAACQALQQFANKKLKLSPSTSNNSEVSRATSTQGLAEEVSNLVAVLERTQMEVQGTGQGEGAATIPLLEATANAMENMSGEMMQPVESTADTLQPTDLVDQVDLEGTNWRDIVAKISQDMEVDVESGTGGSVQQPVAGASSTGGFPYNTRETIGDALPTNKLVGEAFWEDKEKIWSWLQLHNNEVLRIGIFAMGGAGKTTLVKHIYNKLLKNPDAFPHVYFITVSQDFSISRLQNLIADRIGFDLSKEKDEVHRAGKLSGELKKKNKWVLILDDLWNSFDMEVVGIPTKINGCKLILTTRSIEVCRQIGCEKKIKVKPLSEEESWTLFTEKLGRDVTLSPEISKIAQSVAWECAGLPLGIITMAATMREVDDVCQWRNALYELKKSKVWQEDMDEVFRILKFSYNNLKNSALQECFLYCALFPEDFEIERDNLIGYLIDEGIIDRRIESWQAKFDKGHTMLNKLENVCLLESCANNSRDRKVKMHDLIRDMALQIQANTGVMVEAGTQTKELPDVQEWTEDLVRVSLMCTPLDKISSSHSPRCPNLSTLLLCSNRKLISAADSFFKQLHGLKILDLSYTAIHELPDSISNLESLTSLLLGGCEYLLEVPSLRRLGLLRRLDLSGTAVKKIPEGIECLSNLRYLNLSDCEVEEFPTGILPNLTRLQVLLALNGKCTVKGKEVACLSKLEILDCHFELLSDFMEYLECKKKTNFPSKYSMLAGEASDFEFYAAKKWSHNHMDFCKRVWLGNFCINGGRYFPACPEGIQELIIFACDDARSLCDVLPLEYATELENIVIVGCDAMDTWLSPSWFNSHPTSLPSHGAFTCLKSFDCFQCFSLKKLFPSCLLPFLQNLEEIVVKDCIKLEEIIATEDNSRNHSVEFSLPKLRVLHLDWLPELKSICFAKLTGYSLQEIEVYCCRKLKRIPFSLPMLDNGQLYPPPSLQKIRVDSDQWWESLEWDHPNTKDVLQRFVFVRVI